MTHKLITLTGSVSPHASVLGIQMTAGQFSAPRIVSDTSTIEFSISPKCNPILDDGNHVCDVLFMLRAVANDEEGTETGLKITANYAVSFSINGDHTAEAIDAFSRLNSVFIAWPYLREFAQGSTCRMGLPPLTLPLMTAPAIARHISEDENVESDESDDETGAASDEG